MRIGFCARSNGCAPQPWLQWLEAGAATEPLPSPASTPLSQGSHAALVPAPPRPRTRQSAFGIRLPWGPDGGCEWAWELESSTAAKWSRHVVLTLPHCAFAVTAAACTPPVHV
jgi:hypothetical protein